MLSENQALSGFLRQEHEGTAPGGPFTIENKFIGLTCRPRLLRLLHRLFSRLEPNLRVGTVAEWLVHRCTAATQRKRRFAGQVKRIAICVNQFDAALGGLYPVRPVLPNRNLDLRHSQPPGIAAAAATLLIVAEPQRLLGLASRRGQTTTWERLTASPESWALLSPAAGAAGFAPGSATIRP